MIKFFRQFRQRLLIENRFYKYLLYAIGEIILVVIGILIALQINNNNDAEKARTKEVHYLQNIKDDLKLNIANIDQFMQTRTTKIKSAEKVLEYYEGKPLIDLEDLNNHLLNVYIWKKFYPHNNTFVELTNSGNLATLTNDSIKTYLLNIDALYKELKGEEEHYRYDTEVLLYEPSFRILDLNPITKKYMHTMSQGAVGKDVKLPRDRFELLLKDIPHKNGFVMAVYEFTVMNEQLAQMKKMSLELMTLIEQDIEKDT